MDGLILKGFIENQGKPKVRIAKDLGMSKQNLYQLFDSEKFAPETIANIESVFKVKWSQIKASVNIDGNIHPKQIRLNGEAKNSPTNEITDKYLMLLEEENARIKKRQAESLDEMRKMLLMNHAMLKTVRRSLAQLIAKAEKSDILDVARRLDKETSEYFHQVTETGNLFSDR